MPSFDVIDPQDAPLAPGWRRTQLPDGTYRIFAPGEPWRVIEDWKTAGN